MKNERLQQYYAIWKETDALYHKFAHISGISDSASWVLFCITQAKEKCTSKDIMDQWTISKQTVHSALKELLKKNIVTLIDSDIDKRSKYIELTDYGKKFVQQYVNPIEEIEEKAFEKLSDFEQEVMVNIAKRYLFLLKEEAIKIFDITE